MRYAIIGALAWLTMAVIVFRWLHKAASNPGRTVRVVAPIDLRFPTTTVEVTHTYTSIPTHREMAVTFMRISLDHGFTMEAALAACEALYGAIAEREAAGIDRELAELGGAL